MAKKDELGGGETGKEDFAEKTILSGKDRPGETEPETTPETEVEEVPGTQVTDEEEITLSQKELDKRINDGKAELGRELKETKDLLTSQKTAFGAQTTQITTLETELTKIQDRFDAAELEANKGDPQAFDIVKERQALRKRETELIKGEAKLTRDKAEQGAALTAAKEVATVARATNLATKHGCDVTQLLALSDGDPKRMEALAKALPKVSKEGAGAEGSEKKGVTGSSISGKGGGKARTLQQWEEAYNRGEIDAAKMGEIYRQYNIY